MNDAVFLFPGQGSQYVGMGKSLWETFPYVRQMFDEASEIAERDLAALCFEGPDSLLVQTEHVQPVITLVNLAMLHVLRAEGIEPIAELVVPVLGDPDLGMRHSGHILGLCPTTFAALQKHSARPPYTETARCSCSAARAPARPTRCWPASPG